ncbi:hypothetical protein BC739_001222 [Kutzneria viridogrisea]|uniref:Uncharacterized protein n=1 Tax=Kutzneria viridogrisea TaxID=47990 RepID=A0ABR6BAX2_9PSEU|nr:hypothetical protein [Kutzneria viridogrisea]
MVRNQVFACRAGWLRLPRDLREAITFAHGTDPAAHREAMADAIQWYAGEQAVLRNISGTVHPAVERIARRLAASATGSDRMWQRHIADAQHLSGIAIAAFLRTTAADSVGLDPARMIVVADQFDPQGGRHGA